MFKKKASNDWVGRVLGVFTLTPYDVWRKQHSIHHATHGNLDKRGMGDIDLMTLQEYRAQPLLKRFLYRLYRHPIVMFGLGPSFVFFILYRYPSGLLSAGWIYWISAMGTNLGILAVGALMMWWLGWGAFLMVQIPITIIAATIGIWLFYVQHQFEDAFWEEGENWTLQDAALYGSSFYDLPKPLQWLTANIGVHHVHHLYSKIPFYKLHKVMNDFPELAGFRRLTFIESLSCLKLRLWDEDSKRMVTLREAGARARLTSAPISHRIQPLPLAVHFQKYFIVAVKAGARRRVWLAPRAALMHGGAGVGQATDKVLPPSPRPCRCRASVASSVSGSITVQPVASA